MSQCVKDILEGITLNKLTRMGYVSVGISDGIGRYCG
jgi:hypothetical protein